MKLEILELESRTLCGGLLDVADPVNAMKLGGILVAGTEELVNEMNKKVSWF